MNEDTIVNKTKSLNFKENLDTIEMNKGEITKELRKRKSFTNNYAFPWMSIGLIFVYITIYIFCVYGKQNMIEVDLNSIFIPISNGNDILHKNLWGIITNIFVHRSLWDLINTIFILIFCGFFIEKYIKRRVLLIVYILSVIVFNCISLFVYPYDLYLGSFTIVSFLIGMCIYFSYRFKRFVMSIDIYIYIALTFIGFFTSYMVYFYNIFQFVASYLIGVIVMFILDTKALRENRKI